jgi:elongation factor Ts
MAVFSAKDVAELRKQTGCGMMDCKNALNDSNGDFEAAVKLLREKGMAATAKKADRIAAEGIVDIMTIDNTTAIVEVNSETDFVAKNATFQEFVKDILKTIIANKPADVDALLASNFVNGGLVSEALAEQIYKIGEKLSIRRFQVVEGVVASYIHGMGATGVVVSFETDLADKDGFKECAKNVALQTAAMEVKYLDKDSVPASVLAEEEAILIKQMKEDPKMANKPDNILANIVKGRLGKFYENNCLLEQAYVKDDSMSVSKYVASVAKELGGSIKVTGYVRFDKGEGLQKREEDFAAEIAKMVQG